MRLTVLGLIGMITVAALPVQASGELATQRLLDAMTRHDLCARNDGQLRKLNRSLATPPIGHPSTRTQTR
ncbi:hypothetical protein AO398_16515 [Methylobacterium sp. GXS13]|uniref:hypothetical protein n=1 Tax=Methylobacterium sp. GXS13 TaxID=1730094 RepID=UPI00071B7D55|nr:hypothetical protein [Methylobacterium sp. GXS13]KST59746.1 hypothetical protein AO398_16515 [Methylobacterium sp. GXS13]